MRGVGSLGARLAATERRLKPLVASKRAVEESSRRDDEKLQAAWEIMRATMSPEHAQLVAEAYAAGYANFESPGRNSPAGNLLHHCLQALYSRRNDWPYGDIPEAVAYAMPPEVAEVYLRDPAALALHDCEDCGYKLPHGRFDACPLCGGRIGWYAYFTRRTAERDVEV